MPLKKILKTQLENPKFELIGEEDSSFFHGVVDKDLSVFKFWADQNRSAGTNSHPQAEEDLFSDLIHEEFHRAKKKRADRD